MGGNVITKDKLEDLIDIEHFQHLQDKLDEIYPLPSPIIDNVGNVLKTTMWQDICIQSDLYSKNHVKDDFLQVSFSYKGIC